jgi:hypothetical protein
MTWSNQVNPNPDRVDIGMDIHQLPGPLLSRAYLHCPNQCDPSAVRVLAVQVLVFTARVLKEGKISALLPKVAPCSTTDCMDIF